MTKFNTTANGVKFTVKGFPHSSQDTETMSCAETSLWAIMEYFSNKYSDYKPVLPSQIINTLNCVSSERQIPSKGLIITQMSYALREFGFGTKLYGRKQYANQFENILSCYIESGIPLIIAIQGNSIGHAILAIGHDRIKNEEIDKIAPIYKRLRSNIELYDYDTIEKDFVFIDDNMPAYQKASLKKPVAHYNNASWDDCQITYFIAPLYPKIYLEAYEAKNYIIKFLTDGPCPLSNNSKVLLRFYLSSSRSFKNNIAKSKTIQENLKGVFLETSMPKFIWVAEVGSIDLIKEKKANGLIILDATEANINFNKPLILAAYQNQLLFLDEKSTELVKIELTLHDFRIFEHNLNNL